jgi:hypothetical protein
MDREIARRAVAAHDLHADLRVGVGRGDPDAERRERGFVRLPTLHRNG